MRRLLPLTLLLLAATASAETATMRLQALLDDHWEWRMKSSPVWASMLGDHRFDHLWGDLSLEAFAEEGAAQAAFLARAEKIPAAELSDEDRKTIALFRRELAKRVAEHGYRTWLIPLNQRGGAPSPSTAPSFGA